MNENQPIFALKEIKNLAKNHSSVHLQFYAKLLNLVQNKKFNPVQFNEIKNTFKNKIEIWNTQDQRLLLQFLLNYTAYYINKGKKELIIHQLDLYKFGLDTQVLFENNNTITEASFLNFVIIASNCKQLNEARKFIFEKEKYLHPKNKESVILVSTAYVDMIENKNAEALRRLRLANEKSDFLKLFIRSLLLRCTFERYLSEEGLISLMKSTIDSYLKLIADYSTFSTERKKGYLNLGRHIKKLYQIRNRTKSNKKQRTFELNQLVKTIKGENHSLILKEWLLEKIELIKKERRIRI